MSDFDLHHELVKLATRLRAYRAALNESDSDGNIVEGVQDLLEAEDALLAKLEGEAVRLGNLERQHVHAKEGGAS